MRAAFAETVAALAEKDERILLLTGDLGYMALEVFSDRFPDRFLNVGVAEQNMLGIATGLAEAGYVPFVYSIVTFATLRPYEFIRNGAILHQLPVRIAGVGGGFEYGSAGITHHGLEDVGVMRVQPGISVIAPADHEQTRAALAATYDLPGPVYYRLGKDDKTVVPGLSGAFDLGRAQLVREGTDVLLVAMGSIAADVVAVAETLAAGGVSAAVLVVAQLAPPPVADIAAALRRFPLAVSVEAHYLNGGVGSLVCEIAAENGLACRVKRLGVSETRPGVCGNQDFLHRQSGLAKDQIAATVLAELEDVRQAGSRSL